MDNSWTLDILQYNTGWVKQFTLIYYCDLSICICVWNSNKSVMVLYTRHSGTKTTDYSMNFNQQTIIYLKRRNASVFTVSNSS